MRVEGRRRRADRGEHAPPVGVVAEDRALEEVVAGHGAGHLERVVLGCRGAHLDGDVVVGALGVGDELAGEVGADLRHGIVELLGAGGDAGGARGEEQHGVVGRHAAVGVDPVEGLRGGGAQGGVERGGLGDGVGRHDDEHRGQGGGEHAGALGHAADRPAVAGGDGGLGHGVGGHDRLGGGGAAVARQRGGGGVDPGEQEVHRQPLTDEAGGADDDVAGGHVEDGADVLGGAVGVLEARRAGAGVGAAGVEHDRVRPAVGDDLLDQVTGAASTRLLVKTAAAAWSGPSLTTSARSGRRRP